MVLDQRAELVHAADVKVSSLVPHLTPRQSKDGGSREGQDQNELVEDGTMISHHDAEGVQDRVDDIIVWVMRHT